VTDERAIQLESALSAQAALIEEAQAEIARYLSKEAVSLKRDGVAGVR
jgi:hypothetical protein